MTVGNRVLDSGSVIRLAAGLRTRRQKLGGAATVAKRYGGDHELDFQSVRNVFHRSERNALLSTLDAIQVLELARGHGACEPGHRPQLRYQNSRPSYSPSSDTRCRTIRTRKSATALVFTRPSCNTCWRTTSFPTCAYFERRREFVLAEGVIGVIALEVED